MLKVFLIGFLLIQATLCGQKASTSAPTKPAVNSMVNSPAPTPTPPNEKTVSECTLNRTQGLGTGINISQDLCFDANKPVDAKEKSNAKVGNSPESATIEETNLPFDKLPAEVQIIVKITVPDIDTSQIVFDLTIIPTPDTIAKNVLVKSYSYSSSSKNKASGNDLNHHTWSFKRQNNLLKLDFAEIDTTK